MAQLANVKSAYAQASKQLRSATVRAPFAGVIATKTSRSRRPFGPVRSMATLMTSRADPIEALAGATRTLGGHRHPAQKVLVIVQAAAALFD